MDGIIFDVDGTLWDSVEVVAESWNLAIKENSDLEPNLNREILQGLFGKTMDEIAAGVFPDLDPDSRRKLMDICFDYENRYLETHPGVYYEGVMDTLKELALEYPLFIVSNCQCGYIEGKRRHGTIYQRFPLFWPDADFQRPDDSEINGEK